MNASKSRAALLEFLDYLARKGLMNKTTALSRKAAVNNVLGILDEDEADDVSTLDLDDAMTRFRNVYGMKYTPDSLSTYKSRVKSSIEDFLSYRENPMAFKVGRSTNGRKAVDRQKGGESKTGELVSKQLPLTVARATPSVSPTILPIPLRADLTIYIQGLPYNLTSSEASKIANVVKAMAVED